MAPRKQLHEVSKAIQVHTSDIIVQDANWQLSEIHREMELLNKREAVNRRHWRCVNRKRKAGLPLPKKKPKPPKKAPPKKIWINRKKKATSKTQNSPIQSFQPLFGVGEAQSSGANMMSMHGDTIAAELQHRQRYQKHITEMMLKEKSSGHNGTMRLKCHKEMHDTIDQQLKVLDKISKRLNKLSFGVGVDGDDDNMCNFMDANTDDCRDEQNEETVREAALGDEFH